MRTIETIIQRLEYNKSENLIHLNDIEKCSILSKHDKKVAQELRPYAVYVVNKKNTGRIFR